MTSNTEQAETSPETKPAKKAARGARRANAAPVKGKAAQKATPKKKVPRSARNDAREGQQNRLDSRNAEAPGRRHGQGPAQSDRLAAAFAPRFPVGHGRQKDGFDRHLNERRRWRARLLREGLKLANVFVAAGFKTGGFFAALTIPETLFPPPVNPGPGAPTANNRHLFGNRLHARNADANPSSAAIEPALKSIKLTRSHRTQSQPLATAGRREQVRSYVHPFLCRGLIAGLHPRRARIRPRPPAHSQLARLSQVIRRRN